MPRALLVAANLAVLAVYVIGSGFWVSTGGAWYRSLQQPPWQPPDALFGIAWTYNFTMLAVVGTLVALNVSGASAGTWGGFFALSVVFALAWAYLFYVQHSLTPSAVCLGLAAVATVPMVVVAFRYNPVAGLATLPYLAWLCTATSLSVGYAVLNRQ